MLVAKKVGAIFVAFSLAFLPVVPAGVSATAPANQADMASASNQPQTPTVSATATTAKTQTAVPSGSLSESGPISLVSSQPVTAPSNVTASAPTLEGVITLNGTRAASTSIWYSLDQGTTYKQLVASGTATTWSGNITLPVGSSNISVIAKKTAVVSGVSTTLSSASTSLTVAYAAPVVLVPTLSAGTPTSAGLVTLSGTKTANTSIWYSLNGGAYTQLVATGTATTWNGNITLPVGSSNISVIAKKTAVVSGVSTTLSSAIVGCTIAYAAPVVAVPTVTAGTPATTGGVALSGTKTANTSIWYSLNGGAYVQLVAAGTVTAWTGNITLALGSNTVSVIAKMTAVVSGVSTTLSSAAVNLPMLTYNVPVPTVSVGTPTSAGLATLSGTKTANTSIWYSLNGGTYTQLVAAGTATAWTGNITLAVGSNTISVITRATAVIFGVSTTLSSAVVSRTIAYAAPVVAVPTANIGNLASPGVLPLSGTKATNTSIWYSLNGATYTQLVAVGTATTWTGNITLAVGSNTVSIVAKTTAVVSGVSTVISSPAVNLGVITYVPPAVQTYVAALQQQMGGVFNVTVVGQANGACSVTLKNRAVTNPQIQQGLIDELSFVLTSSGQLQAGSVKTSYCWMTGIDGQVLFEGMKLLQSGASDLDAFALLTKIVVTGTGTIPVSPTYYFMKDGVSCKAYRGEDGKVVLETQIPSAVQAYEDQLKVQLQPLGYNVTVEMQGGVCIMHVDFKPLDTPLKEGLKSLSFTVSKDATIDPNSVQATYVRGTRIYICTASKCDLAVDGALFFNALMQIPQLGDPIVLMVKAIVNNIRNHGAIYFELNGRFYKAFRDDQGRVILNPSELQVYVDQLQQATGNGFKVRATFELPIDPSYEGLSFTVTITDVKNDLTASPMGLKQMSFRLLYFYSSTDVSMLQVGVGTYYGPAGDIQPDMQLLFSGMKLLNPSASDADALALMTQLTIDKAGANGIRFTLNGHSSRVAWDRNGNAVLYPVELITVQGQEMDLGELMSALEGNYVTSGITEAQLRASLIATAQYETSIRQAYSFMTDPANNILPANSYVPVLLLQGIDPAKLAQIGSGLNNFAMAISNLNIVVMALEPVQALSAQDPVARRNWIVVKASHEARHCLDFTADPGMPILTSEAHAYAATVKAMRAVGGFSPEQVDAQDRVAAAFNVLANNPGAIMNIFSSGVENFRYVNYSGIKLFDDSKVQIKLTWNGQNKFVDVDAKASAGAQLSVELTKINPDGSLVNIGEISRQSVLDMIAVQLSGDARDTAIASINALPSGAAFYSVQYISGNFQTVSYSCYTEKQDFNKPHMMYCPQGNFLIKGYDGAGAPLFEDRLFTWGASGGSSLHIWTLQPSDWMAVHVSLIKAYDPQGNTVFEQRFDNSMTVISTTYYQYDWNSLLQPNIPSDAVVFPSTLKYYNTSGVLLREFVMDANGKIMSMTVYGSAPITQFPASISVIDAQGRLYSTIFYNAQGQILNVQKY